HRLVDGIDRRFEDSRATVQKSDRRGGSRVLDRVLAVSRLSIHQSRFLAPDLGWRETDGVCAYQCAPAHSLLPSIRSLVFGRHPQLLLLWRISRRVSHQTDWNTLRDSIQPRAADHDGPGRIG